MKRRDPLVRAACRIAPKLSPQTNGSAGQLSHDVSGLMDCLAAVQRLRRLQRVARERDWSLAAARLGEDVFHEVRRALEMAGSVVSRGERPRSQPPSLRCLVEDLRQLTEEFDEVEFDLKAGRIVATTTPIELEDVALGPFAIELHLGRLASRQDSSCFDCVAVKPNPASTNESVTHPHVQDHQLCAGEAAAPISAALRQGRICDAFCLVRSVLQTYNPASPYVALDEWDGVTCSDWPPQCSARARHWRRSGASCATKGSRPPRSTPR